jgi:alkanesulfonate monooxygenase SsuD/methylene tetrahydromethanopterin reductase-like flavin-dependent oxidoreductase (luciferase family)
MRVGVGLWTMRATAAHPASAPALYRDLVSDARRAESLGFHSLWVAEHHFWYDGWCPSPLAAAAAVLGATSTLNVGTGIHLLPLCDPERAAAQLGWLQRASRGRLQHGVGLGYRAGEYDGYGISRRMRARRMEVALDVIARLGDDAPPVWVGGFAPAALERAGRLGLGVLLPSTLSASQLERAIAHAREAAAAAGRTVRIGVMKYAWVTDGRDGARAWAHEALASFTREYAGAWFPLRGRPGFESPELLDMQMRRTADTALIGPVEQLIAQLRALAEAGVEQVVLHLVGDGRLPERHEALTLIAERVVPALDGVSP